MHNGFDSRPPFMYKKHPGIWTALYFLELLFFIQIFMDIMHVPYIIQGNVKCMITSVAFFWMVYYHGRWIEGKMK